MTDDSKIIELFFARDEQAIADMSARYGAVCQRVAKNILKNDLDAEECVNDTYLAVWNTIPPERPNPLKTYILRIVRNIATARYHSNTALKRNSFYDTALDELEDILTDPSNVEGEFEARELSKQIDSFLDTLDSRNRIMFVRRYWYSDSISEIAGIFGLTEHNVTVRLSRTRKKLKNHLKKEGYEL